MPAEEVTQWIVQLAKGDQQAAGMLWEAYFDKLVRFARRKLGGIPCRAADEEDVALSAMHSFCRGMADHRFEDIGDREDLWKLLVTITARKVCAQKRRHFAEKRGGGAVRGESAFLDAAPDEENEQGIGRVLGREPTPELANMVAEDCRLCWIGWTTKRFAEWPSGRSKATARRRLPKSSVAFGGAWSGSWAIREKWSRAKEDT